MIGIDALVQQRLMMDFEKRLIKVEDASFRSRFARRHRHHRRAASAAS